MADRKIKLNGRLFHYKGPNHPRINDLLNLLEDRQVKFNLTEGLISWRWIPPKND